jgi:hypothetical protein
MGKRRLEGPPHPNPLPRGEREVLIRFLSRQRRGWLLIRPPGALAGVPE